MAAAVSYATFGRAFIDAAVTGARVEGALREAVGDGIDERFELGGGAVVAVAKGAIEAVTVERVGHEDTELGRLLGFEVTIRVPLVLEVHVLQRAHGFEGHVEVTLSMKVITQDPPAIDIAIEDPSTRDITVLLDGSSRPVRAAGTMVRIRPAVARRVRNIVRARLEEPAVVALRHVSVTDMIDEVWPA